MKAIVGPTASGKSQVAVAVAAALGAEVVCADAMTLYRELDVGTAKPTSAQRRAVRHHLLDVAELGGRPTVADIAQAARAAVTEIEGRGRTPLVVGGSGLYLRAILDGLDFPPTDPETRRRIEALSPDEALARLRSMDEAALEVLDPANRRRVVRALEVIELTGQPWSDQRRQWEHRAEIPILGLAASAEALHARITTRTKSMLAGGWIDEARRLHGRQDDVLATGAIGYREVFAVLDGEMTLDQAEAAIIRLTGRLAKRQMTWFRADPRVIWIEADDLEAATQDVLAAYA